MRTRASFAVALGIAFASLLLAQQVQREAALPLLPPSVQGECLATVVSSRDGLVLLPAHCVENLGRNGNNNEVIIQDWSLNHFTKIQLQRTMIHPLYRPGEAAFDFALGFAADPAAANAIGPMLLLDTLSSIMTPAKLAKTADLSVYSIRQAVIGQKEPTLTSGKLAFASSGACGAEGIDSTSASSVVGCFVGTWSSKAECEDNFSEHQFIGLTAHTKSLDDKLYLYGFVSRGSRCSETRDQVFAVGHVKNALDFVNSELDRLRNADDLTPGTEVSGGDGSSASGSSVPPASPVPMATSSSPSPVPSNPISTSSSPSSVPARPVPTSSSPIPGGETNGDSSIASSLIVAPDLLPPNIQGECLGVQVDERFLLFPAHCAENIGKHGNSHEVALFGDTTSFVKKVQIQRTAIHPSYRPGETAFDFALGFAGWGAEFSGLSELRLDTTLYFQFQAEHPKAEDLSVYSICRAVTDPNKLAVARGKIAFASSSTCGTEATGANSSNVACFIGTWRSKAECEDNFTGHQIIVQTMHFESHFLGDTDYLSGFVSRSSRCSESGEQVFTVNRFQSALEFIREERQLLDSGFDSTPGGEASGDSDSSGSGSWSFAPTVLPQSDHGECLGVIVSDSLVLLPAHCAVNLGKHGNTDEVALQGTSWDGPGVTNVPIQRFKIHPLYRPGEAAFDFALGVADPAVLALIWQGLLLDRFSVFQSQAEHPKPEDLSVYSIRQTETDGNDVTVTRGNVAYTSSSVCGASSSVECLIGTWSDYTECDNNFSGHQLTAQAIHYDGLSDENYLRGFVTRSSRCSRTGYQVFAFARFENAREFIESELELLDFSSYNQVPAGDTSGDSSGSGSSSHASPVPTSLSPTPLPANPAPSSFSPSSSPAPGGDTNGNGSLAPGSPSIAPTLLSPSVQGKCLGAVVSGTNGLVLLPAYCVENMGKHGNSNEVGVQDKSTTGVTKVQLQRFKIHPLYRPGEVAFDFALGVADPSVVNLITPVLRLTDTSYVLVHADVKKLFVSSVRQAETDRNKLALTSGKTALASSGACDAELAGSDTDLSVACFVGKWSSKAECEDNSSGHQLVGLDFHSIIGVADYLYGFVSRSSHCSDAGEQVFAVSHLENALEFIKKEVKLFDPSSYDPVPDDQASSGDSSASGNSSVVSPDLTNYDKQLVTFYEGLTPLDCSGALIAPRFLLTTSTCVLSHSITHVAFGKAGAPQLIQSNRTVLHPRFASGYSRFDVALLELRSPPSKPPISLSAEPSLVGDKLVRVSQGGGADQVAIDELSKCPSTDLLVALGDEDSGALVCVNLTLPGSGSGGTRGGDSILIRESQGKLLLTGIELPVKNCIDGSHDCYSEIYISISSLTNFINAFASGQLWDFQEPPPEPTPEPIRTPLPCIICTPAVNPPSPPPDGGNPTRTPGLTPSPTPAPPPPIFPYIVGLRVEKEGGNFCGGILIDPFHVLTAAHCVDDRIVEWVSAGSPTSSGGASQNIPVQRITIHPQYKSKGMLNDVAVLELEFFTYSPKFPDMDTASDRPEQTVATMLSFSTTNSNTLRGVSVPIWARKICEAKYPNVDGSIVCAGGVGGIDACAGDSGSPLIMKDAGGSDVVVGLVSSGFGCGQPGMPGFYTRVSTIREFVKKYAFITVPTETPHGTTTRPSSAPLMSLPSPATGSILPSRPVTSVPPTSSTTGPPGAGSKGATNSPRTDGSVKTDSLGRTPSPASSSDAPITAVELDDNLPPATQQKVADFFTGASSSLVSNDLLAKLIDPGNQIMLYSTGDTQGIVDAIHRNSELPLNQRADRFGAIVDHRQAVSSDMCASQ